MKTGIRLLVVAALVCGFVAACSQCDSNGRQDPKQALQKYFREEPRLADNGWQYYAVAEKPSGLFAYLVFPKSARVAPVQFELQRLCPDAKLHDFWQNTQLKSFELVLLKNVDRKRGKAKRLEQVTCEDSFDLVAFETGTLDEPESHVEKKAAVKFAVKIGSPLPDADVPTYFVDAEISEASPLKDTQYRFPTDELEKIREIVDKFSAKSINTAGMEVYYPGFPLALEGVPYFERTVLPSSLGKKYSKYFYQNGYVRVEKEIEDGKERVSREIFYNDFGAPAVAIERWGYNNNSFFIAVLEYDARGFLNRVTHFSNGSQKIFRVSIYAVKKNYDHAQNYHFSFNDNALTLAARERHTKKGSYVWRDRTGTEEKYTNDSFTRRLKYLNRFPQLASVLPVPE